MSDKKDDKQTIGQFLMAQKKQIEAALPKHLDSDRMLRIVMTEIRNVPKLKDCTPQSLIGAVIKASQLGLEPGSALGQCYLIPYGRECQFIIGYRGKIDLARRSGQIISIGARCVYKTDKFKLTCGIDDNIEHEPDFNSERDDKEIIGAYAVAKLKDGGHQFEFMSRKEIDKIRARSKAASNGPWVTDYAEMCKKTVINRLYKYLPVSIEMTKAISLDAAGEAGEQNNGLIIDGDFELSDPDSANKADRIADKITPKKEEQPTINQAAVDQFVHDLGAVE
jgi:recombination protein RecT